ncbi:hypothetical protein ACFQ3S_10835 [Mucilaginibacter terrae]|uniref:hypothetical protein n=1 Tax=Mucilaginibacter terrae TaxID=1955052 RepID=UPI00362FFD71
MPATEQHNIGLILQGNWLINANKHKETFKVIMLVIILSITTFDFSGIIVYPDAGIVFLNLTVVYPPLKLEANNTFIFY